MKIESTPWGSSPEVQLTTITNSHGLSIQVSNWGATLVNVIMPDKEGQRDSIIAGYDTLEEYQQNSYFFGSSVGRFANRIGGAQFELSGKKHYLAVNDRGNSLHGGPEGFHRQIFSTEVVENSEAVTVRYSRLSPDGEEGFPGNLQTVFSYTLNENNQMILDFEAETDQTTLVNLTNHAYWNLEGIGRSIEDQVIRLDADSYIEVDDLCIPTGNIPSVEGTPFDLRSPLTFRETFQKQKEGFDHCFILRQQKENQMEVFSPGRGRKMSIWTDQVGVQLYTCGMFPRSSTRGGVIMENKGAFCLEVQGVPDSINHKNFPQAILEPGQKYHKKGIHTFSW